MAHPAIRLDGIGKQYRIGARGPLYRTLRDSVMETLALPMRMMQRGRANATSMIWALQDISFEVPAGEVLGLIGRNGAGKSTLLKILARVARPTCGHAELRGRVGSLLDIGTGFHPELTGRENVFLNGAILGMSRRDMRAKMRDIVEFAEVDEFMDTPVKHYSSGMRVRLAFAVAAHLDSEILLADEVLSVGDLAFQKKCMGRMNAMARSGRTVVFVSHNLAAVGELCSRAALLDRGRVVDIGRSTDIIRRYLSEYSSVLPAATIAPPTEHLGVVLRHVSLMDSAGRPASEHEWSEPIRMAVRMSVDAPVSSLSVGVTLVNELGVRVLFSWMTFQQSFVPGTYVMDGEFSGSALSPGRYTVNLNAERYGVEYYHVAEEVIAFEVVKTMGEFGYQLDEMAVTYARVPWNIAAVDATTNAGRTQ
ncbi:MAG: transporter related protein [Gemmatimonadetes bacterium]|nr:transporter related protein [Gemmatimonadota bacterium]